MLLTKGGPGRATNVLVYYVYTQSFTKYKFGAASAAANVLFLIILIVTIVQYRNQEKWVTY
jgi:ABC-type sugar transport system permease subunit